MNTSGRLVAGSHNRNEFVLINADEIGKIKFVQELSGEKCQICEDEVEITVDGELFVACNECAFPACRTCYEYERKEGSQSCPQCKTRYQRIKGSPRVEGDEEEDEIDDLDHEFDCADTGASGFKQKVGVVPPFHAGSAGSATVSKYNSSSKGFEFPLLTYGEEDTQISYDQHAIIIPSFPGHGDGIHHTPTGQPRPLVPGKDIASYGYGSVAWKDQMEKWKKKQNDKLEVVKFLKKKRGKVETFPKPETEDSIKDLLEILRRTPHSQKPDNEKKKKEDQDQKGSNEDKGKG